MRSRRDAALCALFGLLVPFATPALLSACDATAEPPEASPPDGPSVPLEGEGSIDVSGGPWRMIEVPTASNAPSIVRTPDGWLALSHRVIGDSRAPLGFENALYRSADGVRWQSIPLDTDEDHLQLRDLAYGAGRYVMVGTVSGEGVLWTSRDAEHWTRTPQGVDGTRAWGRVVYVGSHFLALGFGLIGVSGDGQTFTQVPNDTVQPTSAAYGNGRYVVVGSGPMQVSTDAKRWEAHDVDCALPGACITDPSGGVHQGIESHVVFAEGRFFTDQLSSEDGVDWKAEPGRMPAAYASGHFFDDGGLQLLSWATGKTPLRLEVIRTVEASVTADGRALTSVGVLDRDAPLPDEVDVGFEDGLTCQTASCILIGSRLYLVPPPGTARLPDRVPRTADGDPLLSDDCPRSSMIFCDDYAERSGCSCDPGAPRDPAHCPEVGLYGCEGAFSPRDDEWQVDDVAEAGCSCDHVDPNQPATFGQPCEESPSVCQPPLSCLPVLSEPSPGPPPPQPLVCTAACTTDADCPSWEATGFCAGPVTLKCAGGACQPRACD